MAKLTEEQERLIEEDQANVSEACLPFLIIPFAMYLLHIGISEGFTGGLVILIAFLLFGLATNGREENDDT